MTIVTKLKGIFIPTKDGHDVLLWRSGERSTPRLLLNKMVAGTTLMIRAMLPLKFTKVGPSKTFTLMKKVFRLESLASSW